MGKQGQPDSPTARRSLRTRPEFEGGLERHSSGTSSIVVEGLRSPSFASIVEWKCLGYASAIAVAGEISFLGLAVFTIVAPPPCAHYVARRPKYQPPQKNSGNLHEIQEKD